MSGAARLAVLLLVAVAMVGCGTPPSAQPPVGKPLPQERYEKLLKRFVGDDGRVDYAAWAADPKAVATLDRFLARMRQATPERAPERYRSNTERLSYWINLYNATVIREVVRRWPLPSVQAVPAVGSGFGPAGKGFFSDLHFDIGGEQLSLYDIEQRVVRARYGDVRTQFALNCGARSCPLMPRQAFDPHVLDSQLDLGCSAGTTGSSWTTPGSTRAIRRRR
jgi:hypothetical protein